MDLFDGVFDVTVGVTDLRLCEDDHMTPNRGLVEELAVKLCTTSDLLLGVGLTRPFASSTDPDAEPVHWLQVTNLHLPTDPTWQLG